MYSKKSAKLEDVLTSHSNYLHLIYSIMLGASSALILYIPVRGSQQLAQLDFKINDYRVNQLILITPLS